MPYGTLTTAQRDLLKSLVQGRKVFDLGAGDLVLSKTLIDLGAKKVTAIDKEDSPAVLLPKQVEYLKSTFRDLDVDPEVSFLSWPANYDSGVVAVLRRSDTIIYLGKNTDCSSCGYLEMWRYLTSRGVLYYAPSKKNTLIVYERSLYQPRKPYGEEYAALTQWTDLDSAPLSYEKAETSDFQLKLT